MGWNLFKKKEVKEDIDVAKIMIDYLLECRRLNISDEVIRDKFKSKGYADILINSAFLVCDQLKRRELKGGNKMVRKDEDDEIEEDSDEEIEEEDSDEDVSVKKPMKKPVEKEVPKENPELTLNQILGNHEQRLQILESKLFRIQNS
jgi:hypothetical protein